MIALVRKELRQFALFLLLPALWFLWQVVASLGERFLVPDAGRQVRAVLLIPVFLAACFGLVQFVREEQTGTLSYLHHRELGARALVASKAGAGLLLVAVLAFVPPVLCYAVARVLSPLQDVLQPARLAEELCLATAALPAYAAGVFAATLRGNPSTRGLVALGGGASVILVSCGWIAMYGDFAAPALELVLFPLGSLLACAALLVLVARSPLLLADRERTTHGPRARLALPSALVALVLVVPATWLTAVLFGGAAVFVAREPLRPIVADLGLEPGTPWQMPGWTPATDEPVRYRVLRPSEKSFLVGPEIHDRGKEVFSDDAWLARLQANDGGLGARWSTLRELAWSRLPGPARASRAEAARGARTQIAGAWLDRDEGVVRALHVRGYDGAFGAGALELYVLAPEEHRLAASTLVVPARSEREGASPLLLDPVARRLYMLRDGDEAPWLAPLELPAGDTLVGWEARSYTLVLRGERDEYVWQLGELTVPPLVESPPDVAPEWKSVTLRSDHDPLRPVREVVAPDGAVLLRVEHAITGPRRLAELCAYAAALAQSPLGGLLGGGVPFKSDGTETALLDVERRPWLVAAHFALALFLAAIAWLRLGGRRARRPRALGWALAIVLVGPAAFWVHVLLEPPFLRDAGRIRAPRALVVSAGGARG